MMVRFNTGRLYGKRGQRIAAASFEDGALMVDVDRGIDYYLPFAEPNERSVMMEYDANRSAAPKDWEGYYALRDVLRGHAEEM